MLQRIYCLVCKCGRCTSLRVNTFKKVNLPLQVEFEGMEIIERPVGKSDKVLLVDVAVEELHDDHGGVGRRNRGVEHPQSVEETENGT